MFITSLITIPHAWPAGQRACAQGGLPAIPEILGAQLFCLLDTSPSSCAMETDLPWVRGYFLSLNIWQNTRNDFWISTVANSWWWKYHHHAVLEFPARMLPILNPHSLPSYWHPYFMDKETTLERQSNFSIAEKAEPSYLHPWILVHSQLSSQGANEERITSGTLQDLAASWSLSPSTEHKKNRSTATLLSH